MGKEPIAYNDGRPVFEGQIEPDYTKFTWQHRLWDSVDDRCRRSSDRPRQHGDLCCLAVTRDDRQVLPTTTCRALRRPTP